MTKASNQPRTEAAHELSVELKSAIEAVHAALDRRKKLDDGVNETTARIPELDAQAQRMRAELGTKEADIVWAPDAQVPALEKQIQKLSDAVDAKELEARRARAKVAALEERAPEIDADVAAAGQALNLEGGIAAGDFGAQIAEELREAVKPLFPVLAKARSVGFGWFGDFFAAAYLPDPDGFMRLEGPDHNNIGKNLLDAPETRAANSIGMAMAPVHAAMAAVRKYRPYVPMAKRPVPYVIKGSNKGPGGQPTPPIVAEPDTAPKGFGGFKADQPYEIKGDASGARSRGMPPADLNIGRAILENSANS